MVLAHYITFFFIHNDMRGLFFALCYVTPQHRGAGCALNFFFQQEAFVDRFLLYACMSHGNVGFSDIFCPGTCGFVGPPIHDPLRSRVLGGGGLRTSDPRGLDCLVPFGPG